MLNCKTLKVINGPELIDKYVGESERKIRDLFADTESDQALGKKGLHVIIFDEIDSICRSRSSDGSAGSKVGDSMVNQLLSKMDGVDALNNVLIIGMTNRIDLIDSALLRPGRFEIKVGINLPDLAGRLQIFEIHTKTMRDNGYVDDVDLRKLAELTDNFTGAEITGVVKDAVSYALSRGSEAARDESVSPTVVRVLEDDFIKAVSRLEPMFSSGKITALSLEDEAAAAQLVQSDYQVTENVYFINNRDSMRTARLLASQLGDKSTMIVLSNYDLIGLGWIPKIEKNSRFSCSRSYL